MSTHRHISQPTRQNVDTSTVTQEMKRLSPTSWRCWFQNGDPVTIIDHCRCGARRRTPAVLTGPQGVPLGSEHAKPTGPGVWA